MSRVIYALDEFESQRPLNADWKVEERLADRIAKRHKVCAQWGEYDEVEFFVPEDESAPHGFVNVTNNIIK